MEAIIPFNPAACQLFSVNIPSAATVARVGKHTPGVTRSDSPGLSFVASCAPLLPVLTPAAADKAASYPVEFVGFTIHYWIGNRGRTLCARVPG